MNRSIPRQIASLLLSFATVMAMALGSCSSNDPTEPITTGDPSANLVSLSSLYSTLSDPENCEAGELMASGRQEVLEYVNEVRQAHGLPLVTYASEHDAEVTASALIAASNGILTHSPGSDLDCFSEEGKRGSAAGNLAWASRFDSFKESGYTNQYMVDIWWNDDGTSNVGHRRWMLDPFLTSVAYGRVDRPVGANDAGVTAATLWVINEEKADISTLPIDLIAYPFESTPRHRFSAEAELSFSVLADRTDYWANQDVDFSGATITITDPSGGKLSVSKVQRLNDGTGLPNALIWSSPVVVGTRYEVAISGVKYNGATRGYSYWFEVE